MQPTDELYYKYSRVISSVVYHYAFNFPNLTDELYLQANYVFCKACLSYDPENPEGASFETWLRRQLQSIVGVCRKAMSGPTDTRTGSYPPLPESQFIPDEDGSIPDISNVASKTSVAGYSASLTLEQEVDTAMDPYLSALTPDAYRVFEDFLDGSLSLKDTDSKDGKVTYSRAMRLKRALLDPKKIYNRHYRDLGWSIDRVTKAFNELKAMLRNYKKGRLPNRILRPTQQSFFEIIPAG